MKRSGNRVLVQNHSAGSHWRCFANSVDVGWLPGQQPYQACMPFRFRESSPNPAEYAQTIHATLTLSR